MNVAFKTARYILIAATIAFPALLWGSDLSLSAELDKADIKFDETVSLTIQVKWTGNLRDYSFKIFSLPKTDRLKVLGTTSKIASNIENGAEVTTRTYKYTFKPIEAGQGVIYPITLDYVAMPDSIPGQLETQEFNVVIAKPAAVKKAKSSHIVWYVIIGLFIIFSGAGVFIILHYRNKAPKEPVLSVDDELLAEIERIKKEVAGDRQAFFTRLYKALLHYIENMYDLDLLGLTLEAVGDKLGNSNIPEAKKEQLMGWLKLAEKEKFAPGTGSPGEALRLASEIENIVKNKAFRES